MQLEYMSQPNLLQESTRLFLILQCHHTLPLSEHLLKKYKVLSQ
jgi:hypothetical protein